MKKTKRGGDEGWGRGGDEGGQGQGQAAEEVEAQEGLRGGLTTLLRHLVIAWEERCCPGRGGEGRGELGVGVLKKGPLPGVLWKGPRGGVLEKGSLPQEGRGRGGEGKPKLRFLTFLTFS